MYLVRVCMYIHNMYYIYIYTYIHIYILALTTSVRPLVVDQNHLPLVSAPLVVDQTHPTTMPHHDTMRREFHSVPIYVNNYHPLTSLTPH